MKKSIYVRVLEQIAKPRGSDHMAAKDWAAVIALGIAM